MKVCFIAGTLGRGGAERQLLYMLQALTESGFHARVLSLTQGEAYEAQIKDLGIRVEWVGQSGNRFSRLRKIIASLRSDRPDIIQSSHFYTNFYAAAAGWMLSVKSIGAIRSNVRSEMHANGILGHLHLRTPRMLIANSRSAAGIAMNEYSVGSNRLAFLANVVAPIASINTNGNSEKVSRAESSFTILFAGRLVTAKRPELFVKLASRLADELPELNLQFVMAGDGPLKDEIRTRLQMDPYGCKFSMFGEVEDMSAVYRTVDLLVMTSSHEGTPNVILEAMANGIPVIATKVGGVPDLLGEDRGLLVNADDLESLVTAARRIIKDEQLRGQLVRNGISYVAENHSISQLNSRLMEIYRKLNGDKRQ